MHVWIFTVCFLKIVSEKIHWFKGWGSWWIFDKSWWRHQIEAFFSRDWPFVRAIHRSSVDFPHKGQWREPLMFVLMYACIKFQETVDLFGTPLCSLWRHWNVLLNVRHKIISYKVPWWGVAANQYLIQYSRICSINSTDAYMRHHVKMN